MIVSQGFLTEQEHWTRAGQDTEDYSLLTVQWGNVVKDGSASKRLHTEIQF